MVKPAGGGFATFVWPPTGIAFAALLLGGFRLWPAIFLGAFTVNFSIGAPITAAIGIAVGNTFEALVGVYLLIRFVRFDPGLERLRDVLGLIVCGLTSAMISATIGVGSLWMNGLIYSADLLNSWRTWWFGDVLGAIIVAPLLLSWLCRPVKELQPRMTAEGGLFAVTLTLVLAYVFGENLTSFKSFMPPFPFFLFPFVLWGALRFGQKGATASIFFICGMAIWGTFNGHGLFGSYPLHQQVMFLYCFLAITALTGMVLAATNAEKVRASAELLVAKEAAEIANSAKSTFLANMSHEIRTPLGAVIGFSELLTDPNADQSKKGQYFTAIRRNGEVLSSIISDILDFSKVEAGRAEILLRPVKLADVINDAKCLLAPMAEDKGLTLIISSGPNLPEVINTDPLKLRQILLNVAGNAIKFTASGSVEIEVGWAPGKAHLLSFMVKDTGPGIHADDKSKLFVPFSQADSSASRVHGGTGLGLALSRQFAHMLGGDVQLDNTEVGKGSVFAITIDPGATG